MTVRCSALPRIFSCPPSVIAPQYDLGGNSDESDLGDAVHDCMAHHVLGQDFDLDHVARNHGVSADELAPLVHYGKLAWAKLKKHFPSPRVEQRMSATSLTGSGDVVQADSDDLIVLDWKSGRVRRNHHHQLKGYARLACEMYGIPKSERVKTIVVWLRDLEFEIAEWSVDELIAWDRQLLKTVERGIAEKDYNPGEHCGYCPRRNECGARRAYVAASAGSLVVAGEAQPVSRERLAELYAQSRLVKKAIEAYETALRAELEQGAELDIGEGRVIRLVESHRDEIDARTAWPILLASGLTDDDINAALLVKKGQLEEIVSDRAGKGQKGKAKKAMIEALRDGGAIQTSTFTKLETAKKEDPQ